MVMLFSPPVYYDVSHNTLLQSFVRSVSKHMRLRGGKGRHHVLTFRIEKERNLIPPRVGCLSLYFFIVHREEEPLQKANNCILLSHA